jgi:LPXTG-motif cell wall-anchored protein
VDYLQEAPAESAKSTGNGAGNNPSTWAGGMVIVAALVLIGARASFRRFM